jgi:hypothetical protein
MNDLLYYIAAKLTVASNSGWQYLANSGSVTPTVDKNNPTADQIEKLPIFTGVQGFLKIGSLFMLLYAGWRLIANLTKGGGDGGKIFASIRSIIPLLIVAVLLWDISIMLDLAGLLVKFASWISESLKSLAG